MDGIRIQCTGCYSEGHWSNTLSLPPPRDGCGIQEIPRLGCRVKQIQRRRVAGLYAVWEMSKASSDGMKLNRRKSKELA